MSNLDNLLSDIYSSDSQSQGVKELANLINNLSQLLLKGISQLETRVAKLEQQMASRPTAAPARPAAQNPLAAATPAAPKPKVASPFSAPVAPKSTPPPPPPAATAATASSGPGSPVEAASMLGVTLKKAPTTTTSNSGSSPSFLTSTVNNTPQPATPGPSATATPSAASAQPDAVAPAPSGGVGAPAGGFRGELAEKLARRRRKVQEQIDQDFDAPDLGIEAAPVAAPTAAAVDPEDSTSSELKLDLEDELRNAFSKLKG